MRRFADEELIEDGRHAKEIGHGRELARPERFRREVAGRSESPRQVPRVPNDRTGDAEVGHLHGAIAAEEDIRGLDIAMNDSGSVRGFEPPADLDDQRHRLLDPQHADSTEEIFEAHAVDELHGDERRVARVLDVVDGDDVRVVELGDGDRLAQKHLALFFGIDACRGLSVEVDGLKRYRSLELWIPPPEHRAHAAGAQNFHHEIAREEDLADGLAVEGLSSHRRESLLQLLDLVAGHGSAVAPLGRLPL